MSHRSKKISIPIKYLAPNYWPIWLLVGLIRLCCFLPYPAIMTIGSWVGSLMAKIPGKMLSVTQINIKRCFPELSESEQQELLKRNFQSVGMSIFETALAYWASDRKLKGLLHVRGMENWKKAHEKGCGILMLGAHYTCLHLIGRLMSMRSSFTVVYRRQKNPLLNIFTHKIVNRFYQKALPRGEVRAILNSLNQNEVVWLTPDIDAGVRNSVFAPFFGIMAASITAPSRIAKLCNAPIINAGYFRLPNHKGYEVVLNPPLENFPSEDIEKDVMRINFEQEQMIRRYPEQYIWQYKRFKTRPPGEQKFYQ